MREETRLSYTLNGHLAGTYLSPPVMCEGASNRMRDSQPTTNGASCTGNANLNTCNPQQVSRLKVKGGGMLHSKVFFHIGFTTVA